MTQDEIEAICDLLDEYHIRGAEVVEERQGRLFLRNDESEIVYDVNQVRRIDLPAAVSVDDLLADVEAFFHGRTYRCIRIDPRTSPAALEARLLQDNWELNQTELLLVAQGDLGGRPAAVEMREVEDEADWALLEQAFQLDYRHDSDLSRQMFLTTRRRYPFFTYTLAFVEGRAVGYFSHAAKGQFGYLENLFVEPEYRLRGIATALVHRAAALAREKGARTVFLPAFAFDTPKEMYRRMGFRPAFTVRGYLKREPAAVA